MSKWDAITIDIIQMIGNGYIELTAVAPYIIQVRLFDRGLSYVFL